VPPVHRAPHDHPSTHGERHGSHQRQRRAAAGRLSDNADPGNGNPSPSRLKEASMPKYQRFVLTVIVVGGSLAPAANAMAALNHNETLLPDA
jgi:hypothetical protein